MFFSSKNAYFFRPLNSKYRECVVACLSALYNRLYTSMLDYGKQLNRAQLIDVFIEALINAPLMDDELDSEEESARTERERAALVLKYLLEYGWLEQHFDEASMQSAYHFTPLGRAFTQIFAGAKKATFRTKNRNTRNTKNALTSFLRDGEIHDLIDAWEFSERIIVDFSDLITELEERKRQLVRGVENQFLARQATEEFFEYMSKRFEPDVSVRLSADNIEKHKDDILSLCQSVRNKRRAFKADAELALRRALPDLISNPKVSILIQILEEIENRVKSASELMIPQVRKSLQAYTNRADVIMRQLAYFNLSQEQNLGESLKTFAKLSVDEQSRKLEQAAELMSGVKLSFCDPSANKLREVRRHRKLDNSISTTQEINAELRRASFINNAIDKAFSLSSDDQVAFIRKQLMQKEQVKLNDIKIEDAKDFVSTTNLLDLVSVNHSSSEFEFVVDWNYENSTIPVSLYQEKQKTNTDYFIESDDYSVRCLPKKSVSDEAGKN